MNNWTSNQFGLVVAYLLPGFIGLAGIAPFAPVVAGWLTPIGYAEASLGPPIYAVLAATTVGMIANCLRWLIINRIHYLTGLRAPDWDAVGLDERLNAFNYLVENHYRYYQFFANTLITTIFAYTLNRWAGTSSYLGLGSDLSVLILCVVLFVGSRDTLSKYYARISRLVGELQQKESDPMVNGIEHGTSTGRPQPTQKPQSKPEPAPKPTNEKPQKKDSAK